MADLRPTTRTDEQLNKIAWQRLIDGVDERAETIERLYRRRFNLLAAAMALIAFAGAVACPSEAATSCARKVVDDWQGNGQVDRVYPFHCYRDAIRSLPVDVVDYSNAKEDILRALAFARRGKPDPGPAGGLRPTADDPTDTTETPDVADEPGETIASTLVDTSSASSVPVPLLVLGGLSILLLAAGGASHLGRRSRTRREGSPPDPH